MSKTIPTLLALIFMSAMIFGAPTPVNVRAQADTNPVITFMVDVSDPASGLVNVEVVIPAELLTDLADLDLIYWDAQDHPNAITNLTATSAGKALIVDQRASNDFQYRVLLDGVSSDLTCTYTVDPTFFPPGYDHNEILNASARLTGEMGVLRLVGIVPMMKFNTDDVVLKIHFTLPDDWTVIQPWSNTSEFTLPATLFEHSEYLAMGPFVTETITVGDLVVEFASLPGAEELSAQTIRDILTYTADLVGRSPQGGTVSVAIIPETFLYGGSAGHRTIVSNADPHFVAHEMFHWWNNEYLTADDAKWFNEGFTDYYSIKILFGMGLWPTEMSDMFLSQMQTMVDQLESDPPLSLIEASKMHLQDSNASGLIYVKGNLFAWYLDTLLQAEGRSLDEAIRVIFMGDKEMLTSAEIQQIFHKVYGGLVDEVFALYVYQGAALPDLLTLDDIPID